MKTKYNKIIEWIIIIILAVPYLALYALKYVFKIIAKLVKAAQVIVDCFIDCMRTLCREVVYVLKVKD